MCGASNGFGSCEVHGEFGVEDKSYVFKLEYLSNEVRARGVYIGYMNIYVSKKRRHSSSRTSLELHCGQRSPFAKAGWEEKQRKK